MNISEAQDGKFVHQSATRFEILRQFTNFETFQEKLFEINNLVTYYVLSIKNLFPGKITKKEFPETNILGMDAYFYKLHRLHPKHRDRYSEQTWVRFGHMANKTMARILKRYKMNNNCIYTGALYVL